MSRPVLLSSLSPGRCFTLANPPETLEEAEGAKRLQTGRSILAPEAVWKLVVGDGAAGVDAQNARGEANGFDPTTLVVEVPRQGFDRLVQRVQTEA